jgi:hypothetical protein
MFLHVWQGKNLEGVGAEVWQVKELSRVVGRLAWQAVSPS